MDPWTGLPSSPPRRVCAKHTYLTLLCDLDGLYIKSTRYENQN